MTVVNDDGGIDGSSCEYEDDQSRDFDLDFMRESNHILNFSLVSVRSK